MVNRKVCVNDIVVGDVTRGWFPFCFAVHDIKKIVSGYYRADLFRARSCVCDSLFALSTLLPRAFDGKKKKAYFPIKFVKENI